MGKNELETEKVDKLFPNILTGNVNDLNDLNNAVAKLI